MEKMKVQCSNCNKAFNFKVIENILVCTFKQFELNHIKFYFSQYVLPRHAVRKMTIQTQMTVTKTKPSLQLKPHHRLTEQALLKMMLFPTTLNVWYVKPITV